MDGVAKNDDRLIAFADYLANDLAEQGLKAHLNGRSEESAALYGFSAACRRGMIDVLGTEEPGHSHAAGEGGLLKKLGIG